MQYGAEEEIADHKACDDSVHHGLCHIPVRQGIVYTKGE